MAGAEIDSLAAVIADNRREIVARWAGRVQSALSDGAVRSELAKAIDEYVGFLVDALRRRYPLPEVEHRTVELARRHALTLVREGFDVRQLVREFGELRRVLFEVAEERRLLVH